MKNLNPMLTKPATNIKQNIKVEFSKYSTNTEYEKGPKKWFINFMVVSFLFTYCFNFLQFIFFYNYLTFILLLLIAYTPLYATQQLHLLGKKSLEYNNIKNEIKQEIISKLKYKLKNHLYINKAHLDSLYYKEMDKELTKYHNNRPFYDWSSFILLLTMFVLIVVYISIGISIYVFFYKIPNSAILYLYVINSSIYTITFIFVTISIKKLFNIWPSILPDNLSKTINKRLILEDIVNNLLNVKNILLKFTISLILLFSVFFFNLIFNSYSYFVFFANVLPCVLIPVLITIIRSNIEDTKVFSKCNLHFLIYLIFIMIVTRLVAIPFTLYLDSIYCSFFVLNFKFPVNFEINLTPEVKTSLQQNSKTIERLAQTIFNDSVANKNFIHVLQSEIYSFFKGQINSFWRYFDPNVHTFCIPKWALVNANKSFHLVYNTNLDFLPGKIWITTDKYSLHIDPLKHSAIFRTFKTWEDLHTVTNKSKEFILFRTIMHDVEKSFHTLHGEVRHVISIAAFMTDLNTKLSLLLDEVRLSQSGLRFSEEELQVIDELGIQFKDILSYKSALNLIQDDYPSVYNKYLKNFKITPLYINVGILCKLRLALIFNPCGTFYGNNNNVHFEPLMINDDNNLHYHPLLDYIRYHSYHHHSLLEYLAKNCVIYRNYNYEESYLYELSTNEIRTIVYYPNEVGDMEEAFSWHTNALPIRGIIDIYQNNSAITNALGLNTDQDILSDLGYPYTLDACAVRFGITNNELQNLLCIASNWSNIISRSEVWLEA